MLKNMKYTFEHLNNLELEEIMIEIKKAYSIIAYKKRELESLNVLKIYNDEDFVGCILYRKYNDFLDLKIVLIIEKYQNQKYGKEMLDIFLKKEQIRPIFSSSRNDYMIALFQKNNFKLIELSNTNRYYRFSEVKKIFSIYRIKTFFKKRKLSKKNFQYYAKYD